MSKKLLKILGSLTAIAMISTVGISSVGTIKANAATFLPVSMARLNLFASYATSQTAVYFSKPTDWGDNINAYIYKSGVTSPAWPGVAMTKQSDGTYSYEVPSNLQDGLIIFNDGSKQYPASGQPGVQMQLGKLFKDGSFVTYDGGSSQTTPTTPTPTGNTTDNVKPVIANVDVTSNAGVTTLKVNATGGEVGNNKLFYKFVELDQNGNEVKINQNNKVGQNYSLSNSYSINTPSANQTHSVEVLVQNSNNDSVSQVVVAKADSSTTGTSTTGTSTTTTTTPASPTPASPTPASPTPETPASITPAPSTSTTPIISKLSNVSLTTDAQTINLGSKIKLNANSTGGVGTLKYQFYIAQNGKWTTLGSSSISSTTEYTPAAAGNYSFYVNVIDSNGNTQVNSGAITVTVNQTTTATDTTPGNNTSNPGNTFDASSVAKVIPMIAIAGALMILSVNKRKKTN